MIIAGLSAKVSRKRRRVARASSASTQKQLLSWGSAHCSGVCMISPLRTRCLRGPRHDADMSGCVPRPGLDPYVVVKRIIRGDEVGLATLHDRQQAVLVVRIGRVFGSPFSD